MSDTLPTGQGLHSASTLEVAEESYPQIIAVDLLSDQSLLLRREEPGSTTPATGDSG